jgi:iron complex transport system ATP-binding protein
MTESGTTGDGTTGNPVVRLTGVTVRRAGRGIVGPLDWTIRAGERWVVLGPNGAGKTTLLEIAGTTLWPTTGSVEVLGARIGTVDTRDLRRRIGAVGSALEQAVPADLTAHEVVMTARHAALGTWWHRWTEEDRARATMLLERLGLAALADRRFGVLSSGERRRVLVARGLMPDPDLLLLDEPAASLDLGAREGLLADLTSLAADRSPAAIVLVTHHLEEVPTGFGHALLIRDGRIVAAGPTSDVLTAAWLSETFGTSIELDRRDGRFSARAAPAGAEAEGR